MLHRLDQWPPFLVYAIARHRHNPMTRAEIASKSGIPERTFTRLVSRLSWEHVPVGQMIAFCRACGVEIWGGMSVHKRYLKSQFNNPNPFDHLRRGGRRRRFNLLCEQWLVRHQKRASP